MSSAPIPGSEPVLEFDFAVRRAGFSLEAAGAFGPGITAVFGPSGAGKSTLLGAIAGSVGVSSGQISLSGRTLVSTETGVNLPPERRRVGFVYQDSALFPHMTVEKNISFGHRLTPPERRRLNPAELMELLSISHLLARKPSELSGGERQRVALARTLATSPDLLLLDEPMSALDFRLRGIVLGYLKLVHRELAMPMVYVSHSISEVLAIADSAMELDLGRVQSFGNPRHLLRRISSGGNGAVDLIVDNILEGEVIESGAGGGPGMVKVGSTALVAPVGKRETGDRVVVSLGSHEVIVATERPKRLSARNVLAGTVIAVEGTGPIQVLVADCGFELMAEITEASLRELELRPGSEVYMVIKTSSITVMDAFAHRR